MPKKGPVPIKSEAEALRLMAERLRTQAIRPNLFAYKPHPKQLRFHQSSAKGKLFIGGNRSGKTTSGVIEDLKWATKRHEYRNLPSEPIRGRVVAVDFINGVDGIILPEIARWLPASDLINGSWTESWDSEHRTLTLANKSFIEFRSYDQDLEKFSGTSRHFVHFDEEPPKDIFTECKMRLIDTGGSWWITMTPVEGMTWVYDDVYLPGIVGDPSLLVVEVDTTENPVLQRAEIEQIMQGLDRDEIEARIHGKFVQLGGLIYKHFNPELHVIDPLDPSILRDWEWGATLDHGFTNPTAWLWVATKDNRHIIFDEHYISEQTVDYHANSVHLKNADHLRPPDIYIGDPSIRNRDAITGTSIHEEYAKRGIGIVLGNNDVVAGVNRVATLLKPTGEGGKPRLLITRNCVNLITEMTRYRWKTYANKRIQKSNNNQEIAHKKNDHACDALRYWIMSRPDFGSDNISQTPVNVINAPTVYSSESQWHDVNPEFMPTGGYSEWSYESNDEYMGAAW